MSEFLMRDGVTVGEIVGQSTSALSAAGIDQPRLDAEILLAEVLGGRREDIYIQSDRVLNADEAARTAQWIKRRVAREPLAYILGRREFWSLDFKVTPDVLVPRPETEGVIERLLALLPESPPRVERNILDLCTRSGFWTKDCECPGFLRSGVRTGIEGGYCFCHR